MPTVLPLNFLSEQLFLNPSNCQIGSDEGLGSEFYYCDGVPAAPAGVNECPEYPLYDYELLVYAVEHP